MTLKVEPTGKLAKILDAVSEEERTILRRFLSNEDISAEWIAMTLTKNGHEISTTTIRTQRRAWRAAS